MSDGPRRTTPADVNPSTDRATYLCCQHCATDEELNGNPGYCSDAPHDEPCGAPYCSGGVVVG